MRLVFVIENHPEECDKKLMISLVMSHSWVSWFRGPVTFPSKIILLFIVGSWITNQKQDLFCVAEDDNHSQPDLQQVHVEVSWSAGRDKGEEASLQPQDGRRAARAIGWCQQEIYFQNVNYRPLKPAMFRHQFRRFWLIKVINYTDNFYRFLNYCLRKNLYLILKADSYTFRRPNI